METIKPASSNYAYLYETMLINPDKLKHVKDVANKIYGNIARYNAFVKKYFPRIPWYYVGILHNMESDCDFSRHLHNGDSLKHRTVRVPKGRPIAEPIHGFPEGYTFEESALDIFTTFGYQLKQSWTVAEMLARFEVWNGMGYQRKGVCSPYLWSMTNHYTKGKYVADGHYDPNAVSNQVGAAALLKCILDRLVHEKQSI